MNSSLNRVDVIPMNTLGSIEHLESMVGSAREDLDMCLGNVPRKQFSVSASSSFTNTLMISSMLCKAALLGPYPCRFLITVAAAWEVKILFNKGKVVRYLILVLVGCP